MEHTVRSAFVYVAANQVLGDLVKIGVAKNPDDRMRGLTSTSFPGKFELKHAVHCGDAFRIERSVHAALAKERVDRRREFFRVSVERAIHAISTAISSPNGVPLELTELACALRQRRQALGLSQVEAATLIGVTQSALSKIENGAEGTPVGLTLKLVKALGLKISLSCQE